MKIKLGDKTYTHNPDRLLVSDAILVKRLIGMKVPEFQQALQDDDPEATKALVYLLMRQAGEDPDWDALDFDLAALEFVAEQGEVAEPAPKEAAPAA